MRCDSKAPGKRTGCCPKMAGAERDVLPCYRLVQQNRPVALFGGQGLMRTNV
jgi:hypothetical protein